MSHLPPENLVSEKYLLESAPHMDIDQWLERLRHSDRALYNSMALEVWSIARTMDNLIPGFWSRFMENRQTALKQFVIQQKREGKKGSNE
ncbi:hypothetical protein AB3R30_18355 [Leptolyngbyaceae cyanobacterium UHCC 1019]